MWFGISILCGVLLRYGFANDLGSVRTAAKFGLGVSFAAIFTAIWVFIVRALRLWVRSAVLTLSRRFADVQCPSWHVQAALTSTMYAVGGLLVHSDTCAAREGEALQ